MRSSPFSHSTNSPIYVCIYSAHSCTLPSSPSRDGSLELSPRRFRRFPPPRHPSRRRRFPRLPPVASSSPPPVVGTRCDPEPSVGSGLADHLLSNRAFPFYHPEERGVGRRPACALCLCGLADGDRVRRLSSRHIFHGECLDDGWFLHQLTLACPLCRSGDPRRRRAPDRGPARRPALSIY
ncbi:Zinc finger, C3HC4 type (RING finger) [Musa troglodytarum]|uniref:Zinc finger, C3HC4 type (RING finger) n=1 Tax=Musa troglodytarum TaxID=320322 RepID=A0A9E7FCV5_9LILI|nr:Zinc finger, C3HC4 type (RING finger) [Musa troglodytarum]